MSRTSRISSSHPVCAPGGGLWSHLADIPEELRKVLDAELEQGEIEDKALIATTVAAIRQQRLAMRIPKMCRALRVTHPELPKRKVFIAVALVTGISEGHIRDLYYAERKKA